MILDRLKETKQLTEIISIIIAINLIIQASYKFGFIQSYGVWTLSLFNPIEIMFGNLELTMVYILVFIVIIKEDDFIKANTAIFSIGITPYLTEMYYKRMYVDINPILVLIITVSILILALKKKKEWELTILAGLLIICPLIYGSYNQKILDVEDLPLMKIKEERWYILDSFSNKVLLTDIEKRRIKVIPIEKVEAQISK